MRVGTRYAGQPGRGHQPSNHSYATFVTVISIWPRNHWGLTVPGREIVSYIPGTTVGWSLPWPDVVRADAILEQMGVVTARYHRAVADFRPVGTVPWQTAPAALEMSELVCHHDLAPYNVVLAGETICGIIDWDLAGPGTALSELAFVAWQWVPLHGPFVTRLVGWREPPDRVRRLRLLLDAYGLDDRADFINQVVDRIRYNREVMVSQATHGRSRLPDTHGTGAPGRDG